LSPIPPFAYGMRIERLLKDLHEREEKKDAGMIDQIISVIESCERFLITAHVRLDGDALGSELALQSLLKGLGKDAVVYNEDPTPENYLFLAGAEGIVHNLASLDPFQAAFILDCSELERVGREAARIGRVGKIVNIDHHVSNDGFATVSLIDPAASSTGELVWRLIDALGVTPTPEMATHLYTAILTDTGSFHYSNTTPEALMTAGRIVACGADPQWITQQIYETSPPEKLRLMAWALSRLSLEEEGKVACIFVLEEDFAATGAQVHHTEGFVDLGRQIRGVSVSILFTELQPGKFKISLRSKGNIDVERVARSLGGGGHRNAAACRLDGSEEEVKRRVLAALHSCHEEALCTA